MTNITENEDIANISRSENSNPVSPEKDANMDKAFGQAAESVLTGRMIPEPTIVKIASDKDVLNAGMAGMNAAKEVVEPKKK